MTVFLNIVMTGLPLRQCSTKFTESPLCVWACAESGRYNGEQDCQCSLSSTELTQVLSSHFFLS